MKFTDKIGNVIECTPQEYIELIGFESIQTTINNANIPQKDNVIDVKALAKKFSKEKELFDDNKKYPRLKTNPFESKKGFCIRREIFQLIKQYYITNGSLPVSDTGWHGKDSQAIVGAIKDKILQAGYRVDSGYKIYQWILKYIKEEKDLHSN